MKINPLALLMICFLGAVSFIHGAEAEDEQVIQQKVRLLSDTRVPINLRKAEIRSMARSSDAVSVKALMSTARKQTYLNRYAAEALGEVQTAEQKKLAITFLSINLNHADALYATACIRAIARLQQADAIPQLTNALIQARDREDGYREMVCSAIVEECKAIGSAAAVNALCAELVLPGKNGWTLEYGSRIVQALKAINKKEAADAIFEYIARLETERPDDPLAGGYYNAKIEEARRIALQLQAGGQE